MTLKADVIVVGAGSAGSIVARRLVDAGYDVLVVEAGGEDTNPAIHDVNLGVCRRDVFDSST